MYTLWKPARILQSKYVPEEVFPTDELERWAESNGYTKEEKDE